MTAAAYPYLMAPGLEQLGEADKQGLVELRLEGRPFKVTVAEFQGIEDARKGPDPDTTCRELARKYLQRWQSAIAARATCNNGGGQALVSVTYELMNKLIEGELPCPACGTACRPTVQQVDFERELTVVTWNGTAWAPGFIWKTDVRRP